MQPEKAPNHGAGGEVAVIDLAGGLVAKSEGAGCVGNDLVCGHLLFLLASVTGEGDSAIGGADDGAHRIGAEGSELLGVIPNAEAPANGLAADFRGDRLGRACQDCEGMDAIVIAD